MKKRKIAGPRSQIPDLVYEPVNEQGVVFLFAKYHEQLGIKYIEGIQEGFPDAFGRRGIGKGRYEPINIEFEYRSSGFKEHIKKKQYPTENCDMIVCWEHDWDECPIEVIELKSALPGLLETGKAPKREERLKPSKAPKKPLEIEKILAWVSPQIKEMLTELRHRLHRLGVVEEPRFHVIGYRHSPSHVTFTSFRPQKEKIKIYLRGKISDYNDPKKILRLRFRYPEFCIEKMDDLEYAWNLISQAYEKYRLKLRRSHAR